MKFFIIFLQFQLLKYNNIFTRSIVFASNPLLRLNKISYKLNYKGFKAVSLVKISLDQLFSCRNVICEKIPSKDKSKIRFLENHFYSKRFNDGWKIKNIMQCEMYNLYLNGSFETAKISELSYYKWHEFLNNEGLSSMDKFKIDLKIKESINLLKNIKNFGFNEYKLKNLPIVTKLPISQTRYKYNYSIDGFEVQDGHHRLAALSALNHKNIYAILVEDIATKTPYGIDLSEIN